MGGLTGVVEPLDGRALVVAVPTAGFEDTGGVLFRDGMSSIGSSLTGVASPLSTDWSDGSGSSPGFFFFTFLVLRSFALDLAPDEEVDGGWCGGAPLSSLPLLPLPWGE